MEKKESLKNILINKSRGILESYKNGRVKRLTTYSRIRKNHKLLYLWFFLIPGIAGAQPYQLTGRILDDSNNPLSDVTISIQPAGKTVNTNATGRFHIYGLMKKEQKLFITHIGKKPVSIDVVLKSKITVLNNIKMNALEKKLKEVTVVGNKSLYYKKQTSLNTEIISSSYIRRNMGGSLMQSLDRLPGIKNITIGSGNAKPLIRGLGFNQVAIIENGIKHEGQQWGADHGLEIDQYNVNKLEIIKGPASFMYGADAIAGAININPPPYPSMHTAGGTVDIIGKSNNAHAGISAQVYSRSTRLFFDSRLTLHQYGDYTVPTNIVYVYDYGVLLHKNHVRNTAGKEKNAGITIGYISNSFNSAFYISHVNKESGFFANAHGLEPRNVNTTEHDKSARDILLPRQEVNHTKILNRSTFKWASHHLELHSGYQKNFRKEWSRYVNHGYMPPVYPDTLHTPETLERQYDKDVWAVNIKDVFIAGIHQLTIGINTEWQHNKIGGWGFLIPAYKQRSTGLFLYNKININEKILLHGAIRFDQGNIHIQPYTDWFPSLIINNNDTIKQYLQRSENITRNFSSPSWTAGINYNYKKWIIKVNAGMGFRMPIAKELAANGVNYHYFRYEKGNASLSAEKSYQLDMGIGWSNNKTSIQLSPFYNYFHSYIFLSPTYLHDYYYGAGNQVFEYKTAKVIRFGSEIEVKQQLFSSLHTSISGEYLYNRQISGSKKGYGLPFSPPPSTIINITYEPAFKKKISEVYFSLDYRITAAQNNIVPPEKKHRVISFSIFRQEENLYGENSPSAIISR